jgi:hypothetical protein
VTGSFDQGVSWFSRLFSDQTWPLPSRDLKAEAGIGDHVDPGRRRGLPVRRTMTYSRPSSAKPPVPLKNSSAEVSKAAAAWRAGASVFGPRAHRRWRAGRRGQRVDLLADAAAAGDQHDAATDKQQRPRLGQ